MHKSGGFVKLLQIVYQLILSGGFLGRRLASLLKTGLCLMKNLLKLSAKRVLLPLGLTSAASATDAAIQNKFYGSGMTTLILSNEEMNDTMKIIRCLEDTGLLIKGVVKQLKMKQKNEKADFFACY